MIPLGKPSFFLVNYYYQGYQISYILCPLRNEVIFSLRLGKLN